MRRVNWRDGESVAFGEYAHLGQFGMSAQLIEGDGGGFAHKAEVDMDPARLFAAGGGIEVFVFGVKLGGIGVGG